MNIDDLLDTLKDTNVTINIQGGTGNTMYTAPVQNNTYNRRGSQRPVNAPVCNICGKLAGGRAVAYHFVGFSHKDCIDARREENLRKYDDRHWKIVKSTPAEFSDAEAPRRLPALQRAESLTPQEQWDIYGMECLLKNKTE